MRENTRQEPTLVLGGTGKVGRRVVERLRARDLPVRVGSRSGEPSFRLGGSLDLGPGSGRCRIGLRRPLLGRDSGRRPHAGSVRRTGRCERRSASRSVVRARRGRGRACGAGRARLRRRADGPALDLVRPELQRGLLAGTGPGQRGFASGRSHARAVRRRRRHRRRSSRGADRRSAYRRALRAHRAPAPHVRRGRPGDLPDGGPRDPLRTGLDRGRSPPPLPTREFRAKSSRC